MNSVNRALLFGIALLATTVGTPLIAANSDIDAEEPGYIAPRGPNGNPDLNGVWQVMNTANFDIQAHTARAAMAMKPGQFGLIPKKEVVALGAVGSVPAGLGVVPRSECPTSARVEPDPASPGGWSLRGSRPGRAR